MIHMRGERTGFHYSSLLREVRALRTIFLANFSLDNDTLDLQAEDVCRSSSPPMSGMGPKG